MGRAQGFDTATAVRRARSVFWEFGYEEASLPALEAATGLNRSSIYHAFGSKRGLFDAAVTSYLDEVTRPRLRPLTGATVAPDAIVEYLGGLRAALSAQGTARWPNGCLLLNVACTPIADDAAVGATIAAYRAELQRALRAGVAARMAEQPEAELDRLAALCTAAVITAFTLARIDPEGAVAGLDAALALLAVRSSDGA